MLHRLHVARLPPQILLLQQREGQFVVCVGQFFIFCVDDNACPINGADDLVHENTDKRVGSHPVYFLANGAKAVQEIFVINIIKGSDVGLRIIATSQPAETTLTQKFLASDFRHFFDMHSSPLYNVSDCNVPTTLSRWEQVEYNTTTQIKFRLHLNTGNVHFRLTSATSGK
jgi:hypothetical protein